MDRTPSDHFDNLLAAFVKVEYHDVIGINLGLAKALIKVMETVTAMLRYEIKVRDAAMFAPMNKNSHKSNDGNFM